MTTSNEWRDALKEAKDFIGKSRCSQGHSVSSVIDNAKHGRCIYCSHQFELYRRIEALLARPEPAAAEKAREPKAEDMAMLIRMLVCELPRHNRAAIRAMKYLTHHGLEGSVLRDLPSPPAATGEK